MSSQQVFPSALPARGETWRVPLHGQPDPHWRARGDMPARSSVPIPGTTSGLRRRVVVRDPYALLARCQRRPCMAWPGSGALGEEEAERVGRAMAGA